MVQKVLNSSVNRKVGGDNEGVPSVMGGLLKSKWGSTCRR